MSFNDLHLRLYNIIIYESSIMVGLNDIIIFTLINILNVNVYNISLINPYGHIIIYIFYTIIFEL